MKIASIFKRLPMRIALVLAAVIAAVVLPLAASADSNVRLESTMGVANYTAGDTTYQPSVNATTDQVVKFQVWYHNMENADSGKVANNLNVKVNFPTQPGKTQTVTATVKADNSNTVNDAATVNLDNANSTLDFIPGSVAWRHNAGTNASPKWETETVSDAAVTGQGVNLGDEQPCFNFESTVTFMARVKTPAVQINKYVRVNGQTSWVQANKANPGDTLQYEIAYKNVGNTTENNVVIRDNLPPGLTYVPGTTKLKNDSGVKDVADGVINGGLVVGNYAPGGAAYVMFNVKVPAEADLKCGETQYRNVGVVKPEGMGEYFNTADTTVNKVCEEKPSYSCDLLTASLVSGNTYKFEVNTSQQNAKVVDYTYDFGDSSDVLKTDQSTTQHTYKPGTYSASVKVGFDVNGDYKQVGSEACATNITVGQPTVTPPTTPPVTTLPSTGAAGILSGTIGVSAISYGLYAWYESRKALKGVK